MQFGESSRRDAPQPAVWPDFIVVRASGGERKPGLVQGLEPAFVQVFVSELSVEALDVAFLHRMSRLNRDVANAERLRPGHEGATGELGAVVGAHCMRLATKQRRPIQYPGHVFSGNTNVHRDVHALVAAVICHGEVLQASST